jgi:4-amino-4-deoxy-L-arabinose transferase-like glycosyltransferase
MPGHRASVDWIKTKSPGLLLALIIVGAASLSLYWVFLVPVFQSPDEPAHLDYAFNIYSARRPISAREPSHRWNAAPPHKPWHVYTEYLISSTNSRGIFWHFEDKAPAGYGTREFYDWLDNGAPSENVETMEGVSKEMLGQSNYTAVYPFGYYAAVAAWMGILHRFSGRLTVLFFGARAFSVLLLIPSLVLVYAVARELRFTKKRALLFTGIVAFFPLTTFVSSYVQPDNLGFTAVMLCCYLALLVRRRPRNLKLLVSLGLALALLLATKYHFYVAVLVPILGMLVSDGLLRPWRLGWMRTFALLLLPSLVVGAVETWVTFGSKTYGILDNANTEHDEFARAAAGGLLSETRFLLDGLGAALDNFYLHGSTFHSFWGLFGWLDAPLVIISVFKTELIQGVIRVLNIIVLGLVLFRLENVVTRLILIGRRGRWRRALFIAFSNPLVNAYFLFTLGLTCLFMVVRYSFAPQGRDWIPFILAIFMMGTEYGPRALSHRRSQAVFSAVVTAALVLYCLVGSYYAIHSLRVRYYG